MWLSLVERCVRDAEVEGSNPFIPTNPLSPYSNIGLLNSTLRIGPQVSASFRQQNDSLNASVIVCLQRDNVMNVQSVSALQSRPGAESLAVLGFPNAAIEPPPPLDKNCVDGTLLHPGAALQTLPPPPLVG